MSKDRRRVKRREICTAKGCKDSVVPAFLSFLCKEHWSRVCGKTKSVILKLRKGGIPGGHSRRKFETARQAAINEANK